MTARIDGVKLGVGLPRSVAWRAVGKIAGTEQPATADPSSSGPSEEVLEAALGALARWRSELPEMTVVAVDGHGAAGKSTLAGRLAARCGFALLHTDDFFRPRSAARRPQTVEDYYDLARLAEEALAPLRAGATACFRPYDWDTGSLGELTRVAPDGLVVLEGVCSGAPALHDLVTRCVLVETPLAERMARLRRLVAPEDWDDGWLEAEEHYFARVRPPKSFDLVLPGTSLQDPGGGRP